MRRAWTTAKIHLLDKGGDKGSDKGGRADLPVGLDARQRVPTRSERRAPARRGPAPETRRAGTRRSFSILERIARRNAGRSSFVEIPNPALQALLTPLLSWFARHARDLPWRGTRDPFAIWISEIMLQQTQVKTVIPYWTRWMRALPDIASLAAADPDRVLKLWEGLGYYTRARNLQATAKIIQREHGGIFPRRFEDVLALPGIGRYTAGAICSIAFHEPRPILDGNVIRVLTRLFGIAEDPRERATNVKLWSLASQLVQAAGPRRCSNLNQSLMELGALVCTPRQPRCEICPVRRRCAAWRTGSVDRLPSTLTRPRSIQRHFIAFVFQHGDKFLVRQRPSGAVNAGLWEFPGAEAQCADANPLEILRKRFGLRRRTLTPLAVVRHSITQYRITLKAFHLRIGGPSLELRGRWLSRAALDQLAFPSAHRKLLSCLDRPNTRAPNAATDDRLVGAVRSAPLLGE